jgi:hypothetical protein
MQAYVHVSFGSGGQNVQAWAIAQRAENEAMYEALLKGPTDQLVQGLGVYFDSMDRELRFHEVQGDDDMEAVLHLKLLAACIKKAEQHQDEELKTKLELHLLCVQQILQERRDEVTEQLADPALSEEERSQLQQHPLVVELQIMETKVASTILMIAARM